MCGAFRSRGPVCRSADQVQICRSCSEARSQRLVFPIQICSIVAPIQVIDFSHSLGTGYDNHNM